MKTFQDILYKVHLVETSGNMQVPVSGITFDSREVRDGFLFVAVRGTQVDGHDYIEQAIDNGAVAIVADHIPNKWTGEAAIATTQNTSRALGAIADNYFNSPSKKLKLVAVTGTNGKTSTVTMLFHLFRALGYNCGLISTVDIRMNDEVIPATHTTPDVLRVNELLARMADKEITHVFMEASSHAIVQERVAGLDIDVAVFTNITHDHLDYHGTFENYINAKKKLFDDLPASATALVNVDDRRGRIMIQNTRAAKKTMAIKAMADYRLKILSNTLQGLELEVAGKQVWVRLVGEYNAYNILAVYSVACLLEESADDFLQELSIIPPPPGRFEMVANRRDVIAIVDYAHTPDALKNVLTTIEAIRSRNEQVITVVGCGGNRDKEKRPEMARISTKYSDRVIFTSDNPRNEDPEKILDDMEKPLTPVEKKKVIRMANRQEAIKLAVSLANPGDVILVAGKGHETYQEIKGKKYDFDDRKVLKEMFDLMQNT